MTADLRAALEAALPDLTAPQGHAARVLIAALTPPAMPEPKWPGAPVMAGCNQSMAPRLHVRHNAGPASRWECESSCAFSRWHDLVNPRPLTTAEYAQHGIPEPSK